MKMIKFINLSKILISLCCITFILFCCVGYYYLFLLRVFIDYQVSIPKIIYWAIYKVNWENVILIGGIVATSLISILLINKKRINISLISINVLIFILYFVLKIWWENVHTYIYELQIFVCYRIFFLSIYSGLLIGEIFYLFKDTKLMKILPYAKFSFLSIAIIMFVLKLIKPFDYIGSTIINNLIIVTILEMFELLLIKKNKKQIVLDIVDVSFVIFAFISLVVLREMYIAEINLNEYEGLNLKLFICRSITLIVIFITYSLRHIMYLSNKRIVNKNL